jgi:ribose/xylose/arabinose/galactoside ABC-type transport system permease subunit
MNDRYRKLLRSKSVTLLLVTIAVSIVFTVLNPSFISRNNITGLLYQLSFTGIISVGMGCLLISGGVDLSAGAIGCAAGVLVGVIAQSGIPWPLAVLLTLLFGAAAGGINAFLVNGLNFVPFITTIGTASVWQGFASIICSGTNVVVEAQGFYTLATFRIAGIPLPFVILIVCFGAYGWILGSTPFGRHLYMCGGNRDAARLAGLRLKKTSAYVYVNSGILAAVAGVLMTSLNHMGSTAAILGYEMDAIAASVLGGVSFLGGSGKLLGCFFGVLLIKSFNLGLTAVGVPSYWQIVAQGVIILLALITDYASAKSTMRVNSDVKA